MVAVKPLSLRLEFCRSQHLSGRQFMSEEQPAKLDPLDAFMLQVEAELEQPKHRSPGSSSRKFKGTKRRKIAQDAADSKSSSDSEAQAAERPVKLSRLDNETRRLLKLPLLTRSERQALRRRERKEERKMSVRNSALACCRQLVAFRRSSSPDPPSPTIPLDPHSQRRCPLLFSHEPGLFSTTQYFFFP